MGLYLGHVFQVAGVPFWTAGLSHWLDPNFINVLLEHWYVSLRDGGSPASPPMYFPVQKTLAYSHGLILYVPLYVPLRIFLHPFQAYNWTVLLTVALGMASLYVLLRKLGLSLVESAIVTALFVTSRNVMNGSTSEWAQRVSVFLIPPILLLLLVSIRMRHPRARLVLAGVAGCLSTLMYVQDFYTAHLALFFAIGAGVAFSFVGGGPERVKDATVRLGRAQTRAALLALAIAVVAAAWTWYVWDSGGGRVRLLGVELRSRDWRRPAVVSGAALLVFLWSNRRAFGSIRLPRPDPWRVAVALGAAAGAVVFLGIYAGAYLERRGFPEEHLLGQLFVRYPSGWSGPLDVLRGLRGYETLRPFGLVAIGALVAWMPRVGASRRVRLYALWALGISLLVLLVPLRLPEFSVWRLFLEPLPGFGVIRDPKRIIYLYELAVALAAAGFLTSLKPGSVTRGVLILLAVCVIAAAGHLEVFGYHRRIAVHDRWVAAPIAVDRSCRSFYIKGASAAYMSRSDHMWSLYNIDAVFVALDIGIPTLNGYSAWFPESWNLLNPQEAAYAGEVKAWIDRNRLTNVCELDIDARTMTPRY